MPSVHIATSREVGVPCRSWAARNLPDGWYLSATPEADVFISVLSDKLITEDFIAGRPCFNFHPGLLPAYRGSGAYSWVIINGEQETGVTLHVIDEKIDHGPIIDQQVFPIAASDTAETLFRRAEQLIVSMFQQWFNRLLIGDYPTRPNSTHLGHLYLRKDLEAARDLTRYARAFTFSGKPQAYYTNDEGATIPLDYASPRPTP